MTRPQGAEIHLAFLSSSALVHNHPTARPVPGFCVDAALVAKVDRRPPALEHDLPSKLGARRLGLVLWDPHATVLLTGVWLHDLALLPPPIAISGMKVDIRARKDAVGQEPEFQCR